MDVESLNTLIRGTGDKCMRVQGTDGSRITEYECENDEKLIQRMQQDVPIFKGMGAVYCYTGTALASCTNAKGHMYKVEFAKDAAGVAGAPAKDDGNTTMFGMMMNMQKEHTAQMLAMTNKLYDTRIGELENKKGGEWYEHIDKISDAFVKIAPMAGTMFTGGAKGLSQLSRVAGPEPAAAAQPKTKLVFQEIETKPEEEQKKILETKWAELTQKIRMVDMIALLDLALIDPTKVFKLVYALNEKPEMLDIAVTYIK